MRLRRPLYLLAFAYALLGAWLLRGDGPHWSAALTASAPWTVSVLLRLCSGTALRWLQGGLYLAGSVLLARAVAHQIHSRVLRGAAVLTLLLLSLSPELFCWSRAASPESLTLSLFMLGLAQAMPLVAESPPGGLRWRLPLLGLTLILWTLCGYRNALWLLCAATLGLPLALLIYGARRVLRTGLLSILGALLLLIGVDQEARRSERWKPALVNVLQERILPRGERSAPFVAAGLPREAAAACLKVQRGEDCTAQHPDLSAWLGGSGRDAYIRFLLSDFEYTFVAPLFRLDAILWGRGGPALPARELGVPPPPVWQASIGRIFTRYGSACLFGMLLGLTLLANALIHGRAGSRYLVPLTLLLTIYPTLLLVYHTDAADLQRRGLLALFTLRLSIIMLVFYGINLVQPRSAPSRP